MPRVNFNLDKGEVMAYYRIDFGGDEDLERRYVEALQRAMDYTKQVKEGKIVAIKPVAYVNNMCNDSIDWKVDPMDLEEGTPLYAKPPEFVQAYVNKEDGLVCAKCFKPFTEMLTDEEIKQLAEEHLDMDWQTGVIEFAKAILRKAQEK